jgi:hypothetical protein
VHSGQNMDLSREDLQKIKELYILHVYTPYKFPNTWRDRNTWRDANGNALHMRDITEEEIKDYKDQLKSVVYKYNSQPITDEICIDKIQKAFETLRQNLMSSISTDTFQREFNNVYKQAYENQQKPKGFSWFSSFFPPSKTNGAIQTNVQYARNYGGGKNRKSKSKRRRVFSRKRK